MGRARAAIAAAASSGLMVARTHRLNTLRTLHCHAPRKLRSCIAALLSIDRLARGVCVLVDSFLHLACAVELLRQRIEYGLLRRRRLGRRATHDEQNRR